MGLSDNAMKEQMWPALELGYCLDITCRLRVFARTRDQIELCYNAVMGQM